MAKVVTLVFAALLGLVLPIGLLGQTAPLSEKQKIEMLLQSIDALEGAKFVRNGSSYTAKQVSDHLRMKWGKAGTAIKTAQQFIDKIASQSSMSGEPYKIITKEGKEILCRDFLNQKLVQINKGGKANN
jgi:hypothetical protein